MMLHWCMKLASFQPKNSILKVGWQKIFQPGSWPSLPTRGLGMLVRTPLARSTPTCRYWNAAGSFCHHRVKFCELRAPLTNDAVLSRLGCYGWTDRVFVRSFGRTDRRNCWIALPFWIQLEESGCSALAPALQQPVLCRAFFEFRDGHCFGGLHTMEWGEVQIVLLFPKTSSPLNDIRKTAHLSFMSWARQKDSKDSIDCVFGKTSAILYKRGTYLVARCKDIFVLYSFHLQCLWFIFASSCEQLSLKLCSYIIIAFNVYMNMK